jgi:hypothetical protein
MVPVENYITLSAILFLIGTMGVLTRRNAIVIFMSIELMLNAANLTRAQPFRDGIHVVRLDDALLVKRVASQGGGRFSLLSQNLAYPPVSVGAGEFAVVGRVVWKGGRL